MIPRREVRLVHGFSPNGRYLAATYREQKHWTIWDVPAARIVLDDPRCRHGITFSRDGDRLAASHSDGSIVLYDLRSGVEIASVKAGRHWNGCLSARAGTGSWAAIGSVARMLAFGHSRPVPLLRSPRPT